MPHWYQAFTWLLKIRTQVLMLACPALFELLTKDHAYHVCHKQATHTEALELLKTVHRKYPCSGGELGGVLS